MVNSSGTIRQTIEERKNKGYGIVSEILAILDEIPLGRYKLEIGLKLRQAMLINGILFNSEAWHSVSESELRLLEVVDEHLLRSLVKGQAKTPLEFIYLETGAIPIRFIISSRRLIFHQTILQREDKELTKRIYKAQKNDQTTGDFVKLLSEDFKLINRTQEDRRIQMTNRKAYKQQIKKDIKEAAFNYLTEKQKEHSKVKDIQYVSLSTQKYLLSPVFTNEEVRLLFALRSRGTECKSNFKQKYAHTNLLCFLCKAQNEDQQHILSCKVIQKEFKTDELSNGIIKYEDIFSEEISKQKTVTSLFNKLFKIRNTLIEKMNSQEAPSNADVVLEMSDPLHPCIVNLSSGK